MVLHDGGDCIRVRGDETMRRSIVLSDISMCNYRPHRDVQSVRARMQLLDLLRRFCLFVRIGKSHSMSFRNNSTMIPYKDWSDGSNERN